MAWLQYSPRHVQFTVANHIKARLEALKWMTAGEVPFGADLLKIVHTPPIAGDALVKEVTAGTVAITLGDEFNPEDQELGGPLSLQELPIFIDIFQSKAAYALNAATDVRDILLGRLVDCPRWLDVVDQTSGDPWPGWQIELTDVERSGPVPKFALHWQIVKVTASIHYPEEQY